MPIGKELEILATTFIVESNLIENIDVSQENIVKQLQSDVSTGHAEALLYLDELAAKQEHIDKKNICTAQALIIREQNELAIHRHIDKLEIGRYRGPGVNVFISGRRGVQPGRIERSMSGVLRDVNLFLEKEKEKVGSCSKVHVQYIVKKIARFHYRFERIHPFVDGNGRSGRLLAWYLFRFLGLMPFVFTNHDKMYTYYRCFDDVKDMEKYFLSRYKM